MQLCRVRVKTPAAATLKRPSTDSEDNPVFKRPAGNSVGAVKRPATTADCAQESSDEEDSPLLKKYKEFHLIYVEPDEDSKSFRELQARVAMKIGFSFDGKEDEGVYYVSEQIQRRQLMWLIKGPQGRQMGMITGPHFLHDLQQGRVVATILANLCNHGASKEDVVRVKRTCLQMFS